MGYRRQRPGCKEERARHRRQRNKARKAAVRSTGRQRPCTRRCGRGIGDSGTKHGRQRPGAQGKAGRERPSRTKMNESKPCTDQPIRVGSDGPRHPNRHARDNPSEPTHSGRLVRSKASKPTRSQQPLRANPFGSTRPIQDTLTDTLATTPPDQPIRVRSSNLGHPNRLARDSPSD